jgi:hypothetical protein
LVTYEHTSRTETIAADGDVDNSYAALVRVGWYADRDGSLVHPHVVVDLSGASSGVSSGVSSGLSDSGSDFVRLIYGRANNFVDMGAPFLPATMTQVSRLWSLCCLVVILLI